MLRLHTMNDKNRHPFLRFESVLQPNASLRKIHIYESMYINTSMYIDAGIKECRLWKSGFIHVSKEGNNIKLRNEQ